MMLMSEAMRLGAMLKPQDFIIGNWRNRPRNGSCALKAAIEAAGLTITSWVYATESQWPWTHKKVACPCCKDDGIFCYIIGNHLNDKHHWTREAIADWLEGWEIQLGVAEIPYDTGVEAYQSNALVASS